MGYHMGGLINQVLFKRKQNDFMEMMFHHIVTMYLFIFGYMANIRTGAVVSFLHDITDVTVSWTRVWAETRHKAVAAVSFVFA